MTIRPLVPDDLAAVVGIDRAVAGRSRRGFYEKRIAHLTREPAAFIALAAERPRKLAGFALARLYQGEFGGDAPEAALDAIGVAADARHHGVGRSLVDAMMAAMRIHSIKELSTEVDWTDTALSGFFARMGFSPAPRLVLERGIAAVNARSPTRRKAARSAEIDYSSPSGDDFEALSHDRVPIRSMVTDDFAAILHIDRRLTGRDRTAYFKHKLAEAMDESGVRVSLVAVVDAAVAGFVMARVELGEFGSVESEAVIDTIGVDADRGHNGVGTALVSQLITNLAGLRVENVRTEVGWNQFGLLSFLDRLGFRPQSRLALKRTVR
ncbi:MAG: GNAT family N-acetyltransferase [Alphaproteobacteria bacterium]|nr:GNAT family N-acetyltransferase [Alphaproteobacteria bacterium]